MVLALNRLQLWETPLEGVDETGANPGARRRVQLSGQESLPPLTLAELVGRHDELLAITGRQLVAVTFGLKDDRDGYYRVVNASSQLSRHADVVAAARWRLELERWGRGPSELELESVLTGARRSNAHPTTSAGGSIWHAPPIGAMGWSLGTTSPSAITRTGEEGAISVWRNLSLTAGKAPRWLCNAEHYVSGGCRLTTDSVVRSGLHTPDLPTSWSMSNSLLRIGQATAGAHVVLEVYDGGAWRTVTERVRPHTGTALSGSGVTSFSILRNDPEVCAVRLTWNRTPGRTSMDLTLRRGAYHVAVVVNHYTSATLAVQLYDTGAAATADQGGWYERASNDANGNRWVIGTANPVVALAGSDFYGVSKATSTVFAAYVGVELDGSGAGTGNGGGDLLAQYVEDRAELVRAVTLA